MSERWVIAVLFVLAVAGPCAVADDASDQERFLAGLRQRRLFRLAEVYCQKRLADYQLPLPERSSLTIELIRCFAEHAVDSPAEERETLWRQARQTAADFAGQYPNHPQRMLVRVQDALTVLAQGEVARLETELRVPPSFSRRDARQAIREAVGLLGDIERDLAGTLPQPSTTAAPPALTGEELRALQQNVRCQQARALRNLALCYPAGSADRLAALSDARQQLDQALRILPSDDPLVLRVRLDQAIGSRLLGDWAKAQEFLDAIPEDRAPLDLRLEARAEAIRVALGSNRRDHARELVTHTDGPTGDSPELDFAGLETRVALWLAAAEAKNDTEVVKWRDEAVATVARIEVTHGRYWGRRAELLLLEAGRGRGGNVEVLDRAANDLYVQGRLGEALDAYDKASVAARQAGNGNKAFELAYKAALVAQQQSQFAEASRRFRQLALSMKTQGQASNAHILSVVNAAELATRDPAQHSHYVQLLHEHMENFPRSPTAADAGLWLGKYCESRQQWSDAVVAYRSIAADSARFPEAIDSAIRCWRHWLTELQARGQETSDVAEDAAVFLDGVARSSRPSSPDLAGSVAMQAVRIRLEFARADFAALEKSLHEIVAGATDTSKELASVARSLLVVALAGQPGREDEARRVIPALQEASPTQLHEAIRHLAALVDAASTEQRRGALASLQLEATQLPVPALAKLHDAQRRDIQRWRATALAAAGRRQEAITALAELARRYPQQVEIQRAYGELLLAGNGTEELRQALDQWRRVAADCPPRTPAWFRAKHNVALAQFKLGDKTSAARLIRYLQLTENLAASGMHSEFEELLRSCGSR